MTAILDPDTIAPTPMVPPWLARAMGEIGTLEAPGSADNPRVVLYHSVTRGMAVVPDSVPWCSSAMCYCFEAEGFESTRSKSARSWMRWGTPLDRPVLGCVVVLWRESPQSAKGHVGLYVGESKRGIHILGGNQLDEFCVRLYPRRRLLDHGYRWPTTHPLPGTAG